MSGRILKNEESEDSWILPLCLSLWSSSFTFASAVASWFLYCIRVFPCRKGSTRKFSLTSSSRRQWGRSMKSLPILASSCYCRPWVAAFVRPSSEHQGTSEKGWIPDIHAPLHTLTHVLEFKNHFLQRKPEFSMPANLLVTYFERYLNRLWGSLRRPMPISDPCVPAERSGSEGVGRQPRWRAPWNPTHSGRCRWWKYHRGRRGEDSPTECMAEEKFLMKV